MYRICKKTVTVISSIYQKFFNKVDICDNCEKGTVDSEIAIAELYNDYYNNCPRCNICLELVSLSDLDENGYCSDCTGSAYIFKADDID